MNTGINESKLIDLYEKDHPAIGSYKSYVALLSQDGNGGIVEVVVSNTIGEIIIVSNGVGDYDITSNGLFTENKTAVFPKHQSIADTASARNVQFIWQSVNNVKIYVSDDGGNLVDDFMDAIPIKIEVYE